MTTKTKNFKPILFSTEMVKAILEGRKTQTRRVIKPQPEAHHTHIKKAVVLDGTNRICFNYCEGNSIAVDANFPKYQPGDILWVRETFGIDFLSTAGNKYCYKAAGDKKPVDGWKPSIFMPKAACRIFLEVTNVRVERLQDISSEDAKAEGIKYSISGAGFCGYDYLSGGYNLMTTARHSFFYLWKKVHGLERYSELPNPWVWVYDFKRVEKPQNFLS